MSPSCRLIAKPHAIKGPKRSAMTYLNLEYLRSCCACIEYALCYRMSCVVQYDHDMLNVTGYLSLVKPELKQLVLLRITIPVGADALA